MRTGHRYRSREQHSSQQPRLGKPLPPTACGIQPAGLSQALDESGDLQSAQTHLEKAIRTKPDDPLVYNNLGIVLNEAGDYNGQPGLCLRCSDPDVCWLAAASAVLEESLALCRRDRTDVCRPKATAAVYENLRFAKAAQGDTESEIRQLQAMIRLTVPPSIRWAAAIG